jgi:dTDP-4-dehydrorhamnose 3,5-epimerase
MIEVRELDLPGVKAVVPKKKGDGRGFFVETYNKARFAEIGIALEFVQDNHSFSAETGTIRGLHFQVTPYAQAKLVRVVRGAIFDVVLDVRRSSPNFGKWTCLTITAERGEQVFVPEGFAHGFCTLEPNTEVLYKVSAFYSLEHEHGIRWDDPALGIRWPLQGKPTLSVKDEQSPFLKDSPGMP